MYLLTDKKSGGVYAVFNKDNVKTVHLFEEEDDVVRYQNLLEADGHGEPVSYTHLTLPTILRV